MERSEIINTLLTTAIRQLDEESMCILIDSLIARSNSGRWISVEDRLPEINKRVLVIEEHDPSFVLTMFFEGTDLQNNNSWCEFFEGYEVGNSDEVHTKDILEVYDRSTTVTHWKEFPELIK